MKHVYLVWRNTPIGDVVDIYSSFKKAFAAAKEINKKNAHPWDKATIQKREVK